MIAQAVGENLLFIRVRSKERVVGRDRITAVIFDVDAQDLAEQGLRALGIAVRLEVPRRCVFSTAAIAAADVEIAPVTSARAKADPVKVMTGLWLVDREHRHFTSSISNVRIGADGKSRDVGYPLLEN